MKIHEFVKKTGQIKLSSQFTKDLISKLIRAEFDKKDITEQRCNELIMTAHLWNLECLDGMLNDYDYINFNF